MKLLNSLVAGVIVILLAIALRRPIEPPDDPWFKSAVTNYPRPVLVKFGAEWCPPCRHTEQVLDQLQPRVSGRVKIVRIDVDEKPHLAAHYGVRSIPRIMLFQDGKIIASHGGFNDADQAQKWIESQL